MARRNVYFYCPSGPPPLWWGTGCGPHVEVGECPGRGVSDVGLRKWAPGRGGVCGTVTPPWGALRQQDPQEGEGVGPERSLQLGEAGPHRHPGDKRAGQGPWDRGGQQPRLISGRGGMQAEGSQGLRM